MKLYEKFLREALRIIFTDTDPEIISTEWGRNPKTKKMEDMPRSKNEIQYTWSNHKAMNVSIPNWGKDALMQLDIQKKGREILIGGPLFSGGYMNIELNKNTISAHN